MFKINLHAHTRNSDGADSIQEMAQEAKRLGHCALVITDHDYVTGSYKSNLTELKMLEENKIDLGIPVIIGSEIMTPMGEYLLFGARAIDNWNEYKPKIKVIYDMFGDLHLWAKMFKECVISNINVDTCYQGSRKLSKTSHITPVNYALIKCHPGDFSAKEFLFMPRLWWDCVHGFEVVNWINDYIENSPEIVEILRKMVPGGLELKNSDAHSVDSLYHVCNVVPLEIKDEHQLIQWIRLSKKKLKDKEYLTSKEVKSGVLLDA